MPTPLALRAVPRARAALEATAGAAPLARLHGRRLLAERWSANLGDGYLLRHSLLGSLLWPLAPANGSLRTFCLWGPAGFYLLPELLPVYGTRHGSQPTCCPCPTP